MKHPILTAAALVFGTVVLAGPVEAKGCLKGAVVGGVAGSMAGHGKAGAAAGCAVGHHEANKKDKSGGQSPQQGSPK
ncbi:hypothetical protein ASF53_08790 [Methylobacterium sp. Leaf123]|uniref:hypothetical protein n=1 Tax=Methylobacterium sp. Leaf123 TaxID=1736264 RepID=UPI0006FF9A0C|nr:hypothetical protein [Methylobacterium sp. Leaf123]KQQ14711.1 hypothetical protein ASF53_08790 [Methylobacterium sp. Leaf123]